MYFYTDAFVAGNKVYYTGIAHDKRFFETENYQPFMFVEGKGEYKTLNGDSLTQKQFISIREANKFIQTHSDITNFKMYGSTNFLFQFLNEHFKEVKYDPAKIKVNYIDIETLINNQGFPDPYQAKQPISAITITNNEGDSLTFGYKHYKAKIPGNTFILCKDEKDMLKKFLLAWISDTWYCHVVSGWNIQRFDIPYLVNRIKNVLGEGEELYLSPWKKISEKIVREKRGDITHYVLHGIQTLDYYEVYRHFVAGGRESYKLDFIAQEEIGEKKLDYSHFKNLDEMYDKDYELYIDYNIHDTILVKKLEDKLGYLKLIFALAYDAKINFSDTMATVKPWDTLIVNHLLEKKIAVPEKHFENTIARTIVGGHVKDPVPGRYKWIVTFDFTSLYPHIIMGWNVSPEMFVGKLPFPPIDTHYNEVKRLIKECYEDIHKRNLVLTGNGCLFHREKQGILPYLSDKVFRERKQFRQKLKELIASNGNKNEIAMFDNYQYLKKIQINSLYGAIANEYFRFFNSDIAESITSTGQLAVQFAEEKLNQYLGKVLGINKEYVIAIDTDSCHVCFDDLVEKMQLTDKDEIIKFLQDVCEQKIEPLLKKWFEEFYDQLNVFEPRLNMNREAISDNGIWRGKKMYVLNVVEDDNRVLQTPKLKFKGIEAVRSSTPLICRAAIKQALEIVLNKDEEQLQRFIAEFKKKFMNSTFEEIASPRTANGLNIYNDPVSVFVKGTPVHTKGALIYNHFVKQNHLENEIELIADGSKVRWSYLKQPNPLRASVISVPDDLPKQLGLDKYIDYEMQYIKTFLNPIMSFGNIIGWSDTKQNSLESIFG